MSADESHGLNNAIFEAAYEQLRARARGVARQYDVRTLNPTALVHEAYLRLIDKPGLRVTSREHLESLIARTMHRILLDSLRHKMRLGGPGRAPHVPLDDPAANTAAGAVNPHEAMTMLLSMDALYEEWPEPMRMFELYRFGGHSVDEIAAMEKCSTKTVRRRLTFAKAKLTLALARAADDEVGDG